MRKTTLLLATLILLCVAGTASAQECSSCSAPCTSSTGVDNFECDYTTLGNFGECNNRPNCGGCRGWLYAHCFPIAEVSPAAPAPLLGVKKVTAVVVRHDPNPVTQPYQIAALSRR